jgi:hypothetical protein
MSGAKPMRPRIGPGTSSQATRGPTVSKTAVPSAIAASVIANPTAFWIASAPPTSSGGQALGRQ